MTVVLELTYPTSKNNLDYNRQMKSKKSGRYFAGRAFSKEYLQFKADTYRLVRQQRGPGAKPILGDIAVTITLFPPDLRRRDLLNPTEALADALTEAHVYDDDSQIKRAVIEWGQPVPHGACRIEIVTINSLFDSA